MLQISQRPNDIARAVLEEEPSTQQILGTAPSSEPVSQSRKCQFCFADCNLGTTREHVPRRRKLGKIRSTFSAPLFTRSKLQSPLVLDPGIKELFPQDGRFSDVKQWVVLLRGAIGTAGKLQIVNADTLPKLVNGGLVSGDVIDSYISLLTVDLGGQHLEPGGFVFTDTIFGEALFGKKSRPVEAHGRPPPARSNQRFGPNDAWFETVWTLQLFFKIPLSSRVQFNIFTKDRLIIPVFWANMKHWLLAAAFFSSQKIRIYDSIISDGGRRHRAVFDRVRAMLQWEHWRHHKALLPAEWEKFSSEVSSTFLS